MGRPRAKDVAVKSALAQLWCVDQIADIDRKIMGYNAALETWLRYEHDCKRWVAVVAANGRAADLPPDLIRNKAFFNARYWRIP
jgi:hypothetical protein